MSSGYDPAVKFPCSFDDCRTRRIHKFTYNDGCRTVITSGGTFKIPDQITVLNKWETTATTHVYQNQEEEDQAISAHANMAYAGFTAAVGGNHNQKGSKEEHTATRKIDVKLYTLFVDTINTYSSASEGYAANSSGTARNQGLEPEFYDDASELPTRFGDDSNAFIRFIRKWGR